LGLAKALLEDVYERVAGGVLVGDVRQEEDVVGETDRTRKKHNVLGIRNRYAKILDNTEVRNEWAQHLRLPVDC
jgi:hypothetical protein